MNTLSIAFLHLTMMGMNELFKQGDYSCMYICMSLR